MPVITRQLAPAAVLALTAVSAHAQDGDAAAGHAFVVWRNTDTRHGKP